MERQKGTFVNCTTVWPLLEWVDTVDTPVTRSRIQDALIIHRVPAGKKSRRYDRLFDDESDAFDGDWCYPNPLALLEISPVS